MAVAQGAPAPAAGVAVAAAVVAAGGVAGVSGAAGVAGAMLVDAVLAMLVGAGHTRLHELLQVALVAVHRLLGAHTGGHVAPQTPGEQRPCGGWDAAAPSQESRGARRT